jgi:hypothetical protein
MKEDGIMGFCRGLPLSIFLCIHSLIFMYTYENVNKVLGFAYGSKMENTFKDSLKPALSSIISKFLASSLVYPF